MQKINSLLILVILIQPLQQQKNQENDVVKFNLKGVDFAYGSRIHQMDIRVKNNTYNSFPETTTSSEYDGEIIFGEGLAAHYKLKKGKNAIGRIVKVDVNNKKYKFKVVGIYSSDQVILNEEMMFTTIDVVQKITGINAVKRH